MDRDDLARRRALDAGHPSSSNAGPHGRSARRHPPEPHREQDVLATGPAPQPPRVTGTATDLLGAGPTARPAGLLDALTHRCTVAARNLAAVTGRAQDLDVRSRAGDAGARAGLGAAHDRLRAAEDRLRAAEDRLDAARLLHDARRDSLTGALQRGVGQEHLEQEVDRSRRDGTTLVIAFVDVDGLKTINDTRGHPAGDEALRSVGAALGESLRSYDVVVRYGGDEFVLGLPGLDLDEARDRFAAVTHEVDRLCPGTTISVGVALLRDGDLLEDAVRRADADLYAARARRSRHIVLPPSPDDAAAQGPPTRPVGGAPPAPRRRSRSSSPTT